VLVKDLEIAVHQISDRAQQLFDHAAVEATNAEEVCIAA
jgi:hypothetical protein